MSNIIGIEINTDKNAKKSILKLIEKLEQSIKLYTGKYWKYIKIYKILTNIISFNAIFSFVLLFFQLIKTECVNIKIIYVVMSLIAIIFICISALIFFRIRGMQIYFYSVSSSYKYILIKIKKNFTKSLTNQDCDKIYKKSILEIDLLEKTSNALKYI